MKRVIMFMSVAILLIGFASDQVFGGRARTGGQTPLSAKEKAGLIELREEEKLARDVYLAMADMWDQPIFSNIAASEQRHMNAVKNLLDKYRIADPAAGKDIGEFTNPEFTELYELLIAKGSESLVDALEVGVIIEEMDIKDIKELLLAVTHTDIKTVYNNLLAGSENHLAAFNARLDALGE